MILRRSSCEILLIRKFITIPWRDKAVEYGELTEKVIGCAYRVYNKNIASWNLNL